MSVWSRFKRWLTGGGSTSNSSRPSSNNRSSTTRASRVSNYGGGGSRSVRDYSSGNYANDYREQQTRLETRAEQQRRKREQTTQALASISKRTDALSSGRSSSPAASATRQGDGTIRALQKLSQKATPPTKATAALKKIAEDTEERNKATNNKYNTEVGTKEERLRARQRIKSGELNADPEAARVSFERHPVANLAGRKIAQGMSLGLSDLAEQKLGGDKYAEERKLYRKAEEEHPWIAGGAEMAGALVSFGGTAGMAEKAGAKLTSKVAPKAAEKLAAKKIIQKSAQRSVNKAVKKGLVGEASEELVKRVGEAKAKKIMAALGTDVVQNWTTGLVYDVATASKYHDVGSAEWRKELGKSAAFNRVATGLVAGGSMLTGGKKLAVEAAEQLGKASSAKRSLRGSLKVKGKAKALRPGAEEAVESAATETVERTRPEPDLWYHAGDKGKAEWYGNQAGSRRGTGHFGTGTYFAGSPEILEREGYGSRPLWEVDASKYNTYRPKDREQALRVHENLKKLNVESNDIDSLVKRANLKESDIPRVARQYNEATTTEDLENIAEQLFSKQDRDAIAEAAEERLKLWHEQGVNPEYGDFDIDDEIGDMLDDLDFADLDVNNVDAMLDAAAARSAAKRAGRPLPPEATYEQAYKAELEDTISKFLTDIEENGNSIRKTLRELGEDLGASPEQIDNALARTQKTINAYAHENVFLKEDSASTIFMKELGFEGVNVKGIEGLDNTEFGSVIYDLRPEDGRLIREGKPRKPPVKEATKAAERNADNAVRAAANNADAVRPQNVDEAVERAAVRTVEQNADEAVRAVEPPETRVVPGEGVRAGEGARTGERTEFRRDNAETAREQARTKRTTNNRQQATQESFDSDFEAFERKVAENHAKAEELKRQIRAASGEEKEALQEQLKQLDREVKSEYNKASLRYHPDRGGSNEWMGKFNSVYDDYKNGKFKSRGFRSAESSTRANTGARERYRAEYSSNGNGTTPPPPRGGATEAGERGFRRPQGKARRYTTTDSVEDIVYKRAEKPTPRGKIEDAGKTVRTQMVDSLAAFEDVERAQAKAAHTHVDHGATDRLRRHQAIANRSTGNHQIRYNGDRYRGKVTRVGADGKAYEIENGTSLKDIFKGMDEQTEREFNSYLLLRHAPDRLREGKPIFDRRYTYSIDGSKNVIDLNDPATCLREAELRLERHPEFARKAEELYQYIQNELQNRVDAGLLSQDTVSDWMHRYPNYVPTGRSGFNELHGVSGKTVGAGDIKGAKGSDLDIRNIRDQLAQATTRNWRDITTNDLFKKTFGDKIATELAKQPDGGVQMVLDNSINVGRAHEGGKYYADIFIDGRKNRVEIEKKFYDGLADLYKNGRIGVALIDTTNDAFSKVASVWKNLITEWSPIFMVKNGMRDFPEAVINSKQTKEFISSMPEAMRDLLNGGPYSTALKDSGISQSTFIDLDKAIRAGKDQKSKLARANELVEMYPRLVEYMATFKKAGVDFEHADLALRNRAAANAADVTVNFGRSGSMGKMLNKGLVPFFNPSVQGWSKFVRNVTEQPGTKERLALFAKATALGAAPLAISNFLYKDNPNYQMISARDKASNYIIPIGDGDTTNMFIKIPRSRFATAYGIPAVNLLNENKMGWAEAIKIVNDQVAPLDPLESTLFEPFLAAQRNETWYGTPIISQGIENKTNPSQEYDANTSYVGRALGKATEKLPTKLQISPKKADYIIDAETGIAGDMMLPALTPSKQAGGKNPFVNAGSAMLNVPKRQFTIDSTTQNNVSSRFYDKLQAASDNNKISGATEEDSAEYKRMNAYSKEASTLTNAIRDLQESNKAGKQEAIYGLQKVRNQLMLDALNGNDVPAKAKTVDAVQKYVGTSYAISNFGSSSDKEAMKVYGLAKYGKLSDEDMAKRIDADKDFYKGVQAIGNLEDQAAKSGVKTNTTLSKAVALASIGASDDLYGAYAATKKSRTESANKMERAKTYMGTGGSTDEFVKLESARKSMGKLSDYDKEAELDKINDQLAKGEITQDEYYTKQGEINYNANISYVGLATSLAEANAPERGYRLYDIKDKNIQKGINLAAMGYTARDYREMAKAVDANGNGYPSKQEVIDYVANSDVEDKATLFDALYYYKSSKNPFGTPTNYTREQAATVGKSKGVEQITDELGDISLNAEQSSSGSGYSKGYRRRGGYSRRGYSKGSSKSATLPKAKEIKASQFVKGEALVSKKSSSSSKKTAPPKLKRVQAKIDLPNKKR